MFHACLTWQIHMTMEWKHGLLLTLRMACRVLQEHTRNSGKCMENASYICPNPVT